jgi:ElaB/YqjD/DUF883 family membrane-anchored ribosome-binding protein
MERNANDNLGSQNTGDSTTGSFASGTGSQVGSQGGSQGNASGAGYGGSSTGGSMTGSGIGGAGSMGGSTGAADASFSRDTMADSGNLADRAKNIASTAGDKLSGAGSAVREKAGSLKHSLADALESGAEKLRTQGAGGGQFAGASATGGSDAMVSDGSRSAGATNQIAGGLQASADWLRDADLDSMKSGIERQVKEHPGRTLAIAVGVGYLLGKAIRK